MTRELSPLFTWRSAIVDSGLPPTSRHVALTLSLHMNERGGSCFPSLETLTEETGLSKASVVTHLKVLEDCGWLTKEKGGGRRKDGRGISSTYTATIPELSSTLTVTPVDNPDELSSSWTVADDPTVQLTETYCPTDTDELSSSWTQGRHEDVNRSSSSRDPGDLPVDNQDDDDLMKAYISALVAAKIVALTNAGRPPKNQRGFAVVAANNLAPGGDDHDQVVALHALIVAGWDLVTAAAEVVTPSSAPVASLEERQVRSAVAGFMLAGREDEARDWIEHSCRPEMHHVAEAELARHLHSVSAS